MKDFDTIYQELIRYKANHDNLLISQPYITDDGFPLGKKVKYLRSTRCRLDDSEIKLLDDIGFVWRVISSIPFDFYFNMLVQYKKQYGNLLVPVKYKTPDGYSLGTFVKDIRSGNRKVSPEQRKRLDSIHFVWKARDRMSFEQIVKLLNEFKAEHGDCDVPRRYVTKDGLALGELVGRIRSGKRKTNASQKAKLESIGFAWHVNQVPTPFEEVLKMLQSYKNKFGNCKVPATYCTPDGYPLGVLVQNIRQGNHFTSNTEKAALNLMGFVWRMRKRRNNSR